MSRYTLLLILNLPFVAAALLSAVTRYKLGKSSRKRLMAQVLLWLAVLTGLILAEPIYLWLFTNDLTQTEPLSLFDVIQITTIVLLAYVVTRSSSRIGELERRVSDLHKELSIRLSLK